MCGRRKSSPGRISSQCCSRCGAMSSTVIMVVTTFVTLCQSAPARKPTKNRHSDRLASLHSPSESHLHDDIATGNLTRLEHLGPSTSSTSRDQNHDGSSMHNHPMRHRQHNERRHDSMRRHQSSNADQPENRSRGRYEHLCETVTKTVHLNTDIEEYNPPFYVEVRCRQPQQTHGYSSVQKCAFNLLHCVQTYSTLNFSRRKADGSDCWQPFTLDVPSGCECMWPIEEFGPLNRRDDL